MDFISELLKLSKQKPLVPDKVIIYNAFMLDKGVSYELEMVVDRNLDTLAVTMYATTQLSHEDKVLYSEETLAKELANKLGIRYFKTRQGVMYDTKEAVPSEDSPTEH
jgi:hypothetical protein